MDSYAAGLIDGEGYIGVQASGGSFQVRLKVAMTDKGLPALQRMEWLYGGRIYFESKSNDPARRDVHVWALTGVAASEVIRKIRPFLTVKATPADIALDFQAMVDASPRLANGRAKWTQEMRTRAALYVARIQEANRRGPDPVLPAEPIVALYQAGAWWEPEDGLFGPIRFEGRFPKHGRMVNGRIYELPGPSAVMGLR